MSARRMPPLQPVNAGTKTVLGQADWRPVDCLADLGCDMIGGMADIDFSLLDVPRSAPVDDPEAYLRAAIAWHFGEDTGCAFWLRTARHAGLQPADRRQHLHRPAAVSQSAERVAQRAGRGPDSARLRISAADAADIRIRRHHRCAQKDCAAAGLGRAGHPMADRGLRHRRLSARPRLPVHDAERAARRGLLLSPGLRAARLGLSRDRHRPALGQEDHRPQRRLGGGGLRRPSHRAGRPCSADPARREPAHHSAAARGHCPQRRRGRTW